MAYSERLQAMSVEEVRSYERRHVLTPWAPQKGLSPLVVDRAEGKYFFDTDGKRYLDFTSQFLFNSLGNGHPRVVEAICEQTRSLASINSQFATRPKALYGKMLAEVFPGDLNKVFFSTGGAEAVEGAIKIARKVTGKHKILSRYRAYHGSTYGAMSLSAEHRNWSYEPGLTGFVHVLEPYCYRCPFGHTYPSCDIRCATHVEDVIRREGGARYVAAFVAEPIFGPGGIIVPPDEYWPRVREICDRHEVMLVSDEVMTGFGRTGRWFGVEHYGVVPDMMTMAKGITGGYVPLGATAMRDWVAEVFEDSPYIHGHTYSGHPVAMAAGIGCLEAYREEGLVENAARMGDYLMGKMHELMDRHPSVGEVRGKGLFCGMELVKDRGTREPVHEALLEPPRPPTAKMRVIARAMQGGVYIMAGAASVLVLTPPLNITREEIDFAMSVVDDALAEADAEYTG